MKKRFTEEQAEEYDGHSRECHADSERVVTLKVFDFFVRIKRFVVRVGGDFRKCFPSAHSVEGQTVTDVGLLTGRNGNLINQGLSIRVEEKETVLFLGIEYKVQMKRSVKRSVISPE